MDSLFRIRPAPRAEFGEASFVLPSARESNCRTRNFVGRVVCVANQKGGVGKTTTSICLATGLAKAGATVLLVDIDPQCNATSGLGVPLAPHHPLLNAQIEAGAAVGHHTNGLFVLPGSRKLADTGGTPPTTAPAATFSANLKSSRFAKFDWIVIDCPPSLGPITRSALCCATELLIPIQSEYFAMEGLAQMIEVVRDVMAMPSSQLTFGGILLTMHDASLDLAKDVEREVRDFFGEIVFATRIPRDVAVAEAPSHGLSVFDYAPRSRGAWAYGELCQEVLGRE